MKKIKRGLFILLGCLFAFMTSCDKSGKKEIITLEMWHNYGGTMQTTMDKLIDEFNSTVGKEKGIVINTTTITSSSELNESLNMIVDGEQGAPNMPDICTAYPKVAILLQEQNLIADFDDYLTDDELDKYVDTFVEEGRFNEGLYVFPIAKSTEVLYVNQTLFDKFAAETGADISSLATFEGIESLAKEYNKWSGGKAFYAADSWFNVAQVGMKQLGNNIFKEEELNLNSEEYEYIFDTFANAVVDGGVVIYDGFASDLSKTGDIICSSGSSAGILFYGDTVTYPDNTVEEVEYNILPYPVFEDGDKVALQRGGGLIIGKSNSKKEAAAVEFVKWLTDTNQNMEFISSTGYLPVTKQAFEVELPKTIDALEDERIKKMLTAVCDMYDTYSFFTPEVSNELESLSDEYEENYIKFMTEHAKDESSEGLFEEFTK
ncbi:MAG: extracellular solute-binding protein [Lachnospiraceae bacterium]|nr:extracellular solute-binding protein [Lachnospiraceae bacterium]